MRSKKKPYPKIKVSGRRLVLRPYNFSDFKICNASHAGRLQPVNAFDQPIPIALETDYKKFKERIQRYRARAKDGHHFIFGVFEKKTANYVGQVDFLVLNRRLRWANIGYHIQNQYFGRGYASEASRLALRTAFRSLHFHRIEAAMELSNKASQRVAINIGLEFEGKRKKFFPEQGGIDMKVYATNALDYRGR